MVELKSVLVNCNNHLGESKKILKDINCKIQKGECILLCGESGSGKTTFTRVVNGLIPYFTENLYLEGSAQIDGVETKNKKMYQISEVVGSVFQNPKAQFFHTDSDSEIVYGLENLGIEPAEIKKRYNNTIEQLKIKNLTGRNIFCMSAGEKQLLAFASVYAMNPNIFVLDEPSANLDLETIKELKKRISILKERGKTIIIAEHRLYYLMDIFDKAIYFKKGQIERVFNNEEFSLLTNEERTKLGLRSFFFSKLEKSINNINEKQNGLTVSNLSYKRGNTNIIKKINFSVKYGEILGVIGKNGAGKSTLLRILCGFLKESKGLIKLDGNSLNLKQRNKVSFCVMQDVNHQLFYESVWKECENLSENVTPTSITEALTELHLIDFKDAHPMCLSGGQKQRLAVALALLSQKQVIVFDEPTSGLDYNSMKRVSKLVQILKQKNRAIIIVSHDNEFLDMVTDKIFII